MAKYFPGLRKSLLKTGFQMIDNQIISPIYSKHSFLLERVVCFLANKTSVSAENKMHEYTMFASME